jgi:Family of unknown function (DUF5755)
MRMKSSRGKTPRRQRGGNSLGPALRMAGAVAPVAATTGSFINLSYVFMIIILCLIIWILYLIRGTFMRPTAATPAFAPVATTASTTLFAEPAEAGIVAVSAPAAVPAVTMASPAGRHDPFQDPYEPPLKQDGMYFPTDSSDVRGVPLLGPIVTFLKQPVQPTTCNSAFCNPQRTATAAGWPVNMESRGSAPEFSQIGILTHDRAGGATDNSLYDNMILPLFGRRIMNGRDKYQYYTMSNTGAVNTKLPVLVRNKNCIAEYGCDSISSGDTVYVQGYNKKFTATVYENSLFSYIPFLT